MITEAGTIKCYLFNACCLGALCDELANRGCGVGVTGCTAAQILLHRRGGRQNLGTVRCNDLGVDMTRSTVNAKAVYAQVRRKEAKKK